MRIRIDENFCFLHNYPFISFSLISCWEVWFIYKWSLENLGLNVNPFYIECFLFDPLNRQNQISSRWSLNRLQCLFCWIQIQRYQIWRCTIWLKIWGDLNHCGSVQLDSFCKKCHLWLTAIPFDASFIIYLQTDPQWKQAH